MFLTIRDYPDAEYADVLQAMRHFTDLRTPETPDEIWLVEHSAVYTQGQSGKSEHIFNPLDIPIIQTDRGGQVTYHGPGQMVVYTLLDLSRFSLSVRGLVSLLEQCIISLLSDYGITAHSQCNAPGVYIADEKICSLGLRVRRGRCYHGLALNVDMDLSPFFGINPCGYKNLKMTQLRDHVAAVDFSAVKDALANHLVAALEQRSCLKEF